MKKLNIFLLIVSVFFLTFGFVYKSNSSQRGNVVGLNEGNLAPELKFMSPDGKEIPLSSLRGKIVLVDFWASWCRPCRMENPNVVAVYNKYKNAKFTKAKGFTIYSVSLDYNKDAWVKAINADHLSWEYHVSDLKGWQSDAVASYNVSSIPTNYLLDQNGIIIGIALRGQDLDRTLQKYLKAHVK